MSLISNNVGRISPDIFLIKTDKDLDNILEKDPVLLVNESAKVVTETEAYIVHGDGETVFSELSKTQLDGGGDPSSNVESVSGDLVDNTDPANPVIDNPTWAQVTGKPTTFAPSAHTHEIADVNGLQGALDDKLDSADALEIGTTATTAKAGDYQPTWAQVSGKPTTFAPAAHDHPFTEITGTAVAGQIPTLAISKISGLQSELDGKLEASQGAAVADAVDETDVVAQFNALLASLRTAGVIAE